MAEIKRFFFSIETTEKVSPLLSFITCFTEDEYSINDGDNYIKDNLHKTALYTIKRPTLCERWIFKIEKMSKFSYITSKIQYSFLKLNYNSLQHRFSVVFCFFVFLSHLAKKWCTWTLSRHSYRKGGCSGYKKKGRVCCCSFRWRCQRYSW